eukprot:290770-Chlamydomonas_euryale.AAC.1
MVTGRQKIGSPPAPFAIMVIGRQKIGSRCVRQAAAAAAEYQQRSNSSRDSVAPSLRLQQPDAPGDGSRRQPARQPKSTPAHAPHLRRKDAWFKHDASVTDSG